MSRFQTLLIGLAASLPLTAPWAQAQESPDTLTKHELRCEVQAFKAATGLVDRSADCAADCNRDDNPLRFCAPFAPDAEMQTCIQRAEAKASIQFLRRCSGESCPECYFGGNCDDFRANWLSEARVAGASLVDDWFCDDSGSPDGLNASEARCQEAVVDSMIKYIDSARKCFTKCSKKNPGDPDACLTSTLDTPSLDAKTQSCIDRARKKYLGACTKCFDAPECWQPTVSCAGSIENAENLFRFFDSSLLCVDAPQCGDGRVSPSEACDYAAFPSGCGPGLACNFECQCEPPSCPHGVCQQGEPLDPACGSCEALVCAVDSYCCNFGWDGICVGEAEDLCGVDCDPSYGSPVEAFLEPPFRTMFE